VNRVWLAGFAFALASCTQLQPAVNALDAACTLGLIDAVAVQASAADRGIPVAELAALLCSVPEVYEAWTLAQSQRTDPAVAAVRVAQARGLL
jgi:hypothetical protein